MGQFPNLPYNPDDNADGLIGVADLQTLLANYGQEFSSAVVSEDGESAIVYMGEMKYPHCEYACEQLPGYWSMPELKDLVPVWGEVYNSDNPSTWLKPQENMLDLTGSKEHLFPYFIGTANSLGGGVYVSSNGFQFDHFCYCTAKQLPRVEYTMCSTTSSDTFLSCCEERVTEGWMPLSGSNPASAGADNFRTYSQAFWRWAE